MSVEQGQEAADSPSADPSLPGDNGGTDQPVTTDTAPISAPPADDSKGKPGDSTPPAEKPPAKTEDVPAVADQLSEALDLLSKPEDKDADPEAGHPSPKTDEKPTKGKADAPKDATQEDAFAGMSAEERKAISLKPKTEKRIKDLWSRMRAAEIARDQAVNLKGPALEITQALASEKADSELGYVEPKQMVALTIAQAALNRVTIARQNGGTPAPRDVQTAKQFFGRMTEWAKAVGEKIPSMEPETPAFTGEIPKDIADLHKVYGVLSEDETKAVAAHRAAAAKAKESPPKGTDPPAPTTRSDPPVDPARIAAEVQDQVWIEATLNTLHDDGVKPVEVQTYYEDKLVPRMKEYLAKHAPSAPPEKVMEQLTPKAKHQLVLMAHRAEKAASSLPPAPEKPATKPAPAPSRGRALTGMGTTQRIPVPSQGDDVLASSIDYLARK